MITPAGMPDPRDHNLPPQPTPLVGRSGERATVGQQLLLDDVRLLTLWGPAGVGKTRLAFAVAADVLERFPQGVWFVDLASLSNSALVGSAIAQALEVREAGDRPLLETLQHYFRNRGLLLVLDNFEQVLPAATLVAALLTAAPRLKVLVTSREPLHLRWERTFAVPPLALPDLRRQSAPELLLEIPSIDLFVERARAVAPEFAFTPAVVPLVARICVHLDGLPLAIELAAARSNVLTPEAMLARLERRLPLPRATVQDAPARHRTLRSAIGWSYDLLPAEEQTLFRWLGVFVGGCTLEAAEAVCASSRSGATGFGGRAGERESGRHLPLPHSPALDALDRLASLVDKSLVQAAHGASGGPRFRLLDTIRTFALEQLEASGELEPARRRHAAYFLTLVERADRLLRGPEQPAWLERLDREHDNLRAALAWAEENGEAETAQRLGGALTWYWFLHGHFSEGRQWLARALALSAAPTQAGPGAQTPAPLRSARARALWGAGTLARNQGDYAQAEVLHAESLALWRELGDQTGLAWTLGAQGFARWAQGDYERATHLFEQSLAAFRSVQDDWGVAWSLRNLGLVLHDRGDDERAIGLLEAGLAIQRQVGDRWTTARLLFTLGRVAEHRSDHERAARLFEESLVLYREVGHADGIAAAMRAVGRLAQRRRDAERATALLVESLALSREVGNKDGVARSLEGLASLVRERGELERATRLFGAAEALSAAIGARLSPTDRAALEHDLAGLRAALGEPAFAAAWAEGQRTPLDQVIDSALEAAAQGAAPIDEPGRTAAAPRPERALSEREQEVLRLIAEGRSNKQIAQALVIAEPTAKFYVASILNKLGAETRAHAVALAAHHGLLDPTGPVGDR